MNTTATRILLALTCGLVWAGSAMSANEMRFSDLEARIAAVEQKTTAIPGLKPAAFLSDGDPIDAVAPNDSARANADEELSSPSGHRGMPPSSSCSSCSSCGCGTTCECGSAAECGSACESGCCNGQNGLGGMNGGSYYAEVDLMFLRSHMMEDTVGKLSETYEFTPRFILGYETAEGIGARARYFTYGRQTTVLNAPDDIRFEFDVLDIEATAKFQSCRNELVVAGGFRFASWDAEWDGEEVGLDAPGITVAADFRSMVCGDCARQWAFVGGARWSVLGGDWEGSDFGLVEPLRDDNVVVQELYGGAEYSCHYRNYVMWARLVFEMQNWHSDVLSQSAGADSLSLVGPGIHVGMGF